jgi:hypothetical protein
MEYTDEEISAAFDMGMREDGQSDTRLVPRHCRSKIAS